MSIFEDGWWSKDDIIKVFETRQNLSNVYISSFYSSNGEVEYKGTWYMHFELKQLLEIYDETLDIT